MGMGFSWDEYYDASVDLQLQPVKERVRANRPWSAFVLVVRLQSLLAKAEFHRLDTFKIR